MNYNSWDEFREGRNVPELTDMILKGFRELKVVDPLSHETVAFLCSYNNFRKHGDHIAHNATQIEIKNAVIMKRNSQNGLQLEELYQFVYHIAI